MWIVAAIGGALSLLREHELTRTREPVPEELLDRFLASAEMGDPDLVKTKFAAAMDQLIVLRR